MLSNFSLAVIAGGRIAQVLILFLTYRVITFSIPKSEVGVYFFYLALTGFIGLVLVNPVGQFFNRFLHLWLHQKKIREASIKFALFCMAASAGASILGILFGGESTSLARIQAPLAVAVYALGASLMGTFINALNLGGRPVLFTTFTLGCQSTALIFSWLAIKENPTAMTWLAATGIVNIVWGAMAAIVLEKTQLNDEVKDIFRSSGGKVPQTSLLQFAAPLAVSNIFIWILTQGYRPITEWKLGVEYLAIIGTGLGVASSIASAVETLTHQVFLPRFFAETHHANRELREKCWFRLFRLLLPIHLLVAIGTIGFSAIILRLLAPDTYQSAALYLGIGALAELFRISGNLISLQALSNLKTRMTQVPYLIGAVSNVLLILATGWVAIANVIGHLVAMLALAVKFGLGNWIQVFDRRFFTIATVSAALLAPRLLSPSGEIGPLSLVLIAVASIIFGAIFYQSTQEWRRSHKFT